LAQSCKTPAPQVGKLRALFHRSCVMNPSQFAALALAVALLSPLGAAAHEPGRAAAAESAFDESRRCRGPADARVFARTRPGGIITEDDFKSFVDARVTPRFPDGLTLLSGTGQFRDAGGATLVEGAKLLILLYPRRDAEANGKIEAIRADYKEQFQQQSVLRADDTNCVSF
jgi:Protein of unknown function (DUF3574)